MIVDDTVSEAELRRYVGTIIAKSNLCGDDLYRWFRANGLDVGTDRKASLHEFWNTISNSGVLIRIAARAHVPRRNLILAAYSVVCVAAKYANLQAIPGEEIMLTEMLGSIKGWLAGQVSTKELKCVVGRNWDAIATDGGAPILEGADLVAWAVVDSQDIPVDGKGTLLFVGYTTTFVSDLVDSTQWAERAALENIEYDYKQAVPRLRELADAVRSVISPFDLRPTL